MKCMWGTNHLSVTEGDFEWISTTTKTSEWSIITRLSLIKKWKEEAICDVFINELIPNAICQ